MTEDEKKALELFDEFLKTYNILDNSQELKIRIYLFEELNLNYGYNISSIQKAVKTLSINIFDDNKYSDEYLKNYAIRLATYLDMCCDQIGDSLGMNDNLDLAATLISVDL